MILAIKHYDLDSNYSVHGNFFFFYFHFQVYNSQVLKNKKAAVVECN